MTDTVKTWIEERRRIREYEPTMFERADTEVAYPRALDALNAVLELHRKERHEYGDWMCTHCTRNHPVLYPCPTVQAVQTAIVGKWEPGCPR